jgi:drug/metabolite transporter (DMT)-like permease
VNQPVHYVRAISYALGGFCLWVFSDTCMKLAGEMDIPKYQIMSVSSVGGIGIIFAFAALRGGIGKLRPKKFGGLLTLGLLHLCTFTLWLSALRHLPLANAYTVAFLLPMVVAILAALFLHEHFNWKHGLAIIIGFGGVAIAVNPMQLIEHGSSTWISYSFVFASMLTMSVQMLVLRIIGPQESRECAAFYPRVIILIGSAIAGVFFGFTAMPFSGILYSMASGGFGSLGWLFMAQAYKLAPAAIVAPFQYSEIIFGVLIGYLIWHDVPSAHVIIGVLIIIASGIYIITHARKSAALMKEEESHA